MVTSQKTAQRKLAEKRRAQADAGLTKEGAKRNTADQLVHADDRVHDENTDREADQGM